MPKKKTLIGILASHDNYEANRKLADVLEFATRRKRRHLLESYRLVFTGGTYRRLFESYDNGRPLLNDEAIRFIRDHCGVIVLPDSSEGGVIVLAHLVVQRKVSLLWPFLTPLSSHLLHHENQALLRVADHHRAKKMMNSVSVQEWLINESRVDRGLNPQPKTFNLGFKKARSKSKKKDYKLRLKERGDHIVLVPDKRDRKPKLAKLTNGHSRLRGVKHMIVALISHDNMKDRMIEFVTDYSREFRRFHRILATGTTGERVIKAVPTLGDKVQRFHSGPEGGDIEIATQILFGYCDAVIFFVDPLNPHPHTADIRVVFEACMVQDKVRMLSNSYQAQDWMSRVIRPA